MQPELELAWQEFESASTYAYAQHEALTKIDRSEETSVIFQNVFIIFRATMENEVSLRESGVNTMRFTDTLELSSSIVRKEKTTVTQLRNEFKAAIRDLRNDVNMEKTIINLLEKIIFSNF